MIKQVTVKLRFTGRELVELWEILASQLFDFLDQGLRAYSRSGQEIGNRDTLPRKRKYTYKEILKQVHLEEGDYQTQFVLTKLGSQPPPRKKLTEKEIEQKARIRYKSQPFDTPIIPKGCIAVSFTLSTDEKRREEQTEEAMSFLFKRTDIEDFQNEHPEIFSKEAVRLEFVEDEPIDQRATGQGSPLPDEKATGPEIVEGQQGTKSGEDEIASSEYAFIKLGELDLGKTHYDFIFKNQTIRLRALGADYIYYLMRYYKYPDKIDVVKLRSELEGISEEDPNNKEFIKTIAEQEIKQIKTSPDEEFVEVIDTKTIGQINKKIKDLKEEKEEAEKNNDYGRIDGIKTELEKLYKYLTNATIQGRIKTFASQKDKIIDTVRKAMGNTLSEIRRSNEEAYNHLHTAFKPLNSNPKSYNPTEDIPWKFN